MAMGEAAKQAVWLNTLLEELGYKRDGLVIHGNNQGSLDLAKDPKFHKRTKHIDIRHHFLRDLVNNKVLSLKYIPTKEMVADCLTKGLTRQRLNACLQGMGMLEE